MSFTEEEIAYLRSQPLARLATLDRDGQPDVVPVGFEFDGSRLPRPALRPRRESRVRRGRGPRRRGTA
jgi:pyridoxamine 5'-phosphate oxidase family protein